MYPISMEDCIFCKIIAKEVPAVMVYEDTYTVAFLNHAPDEPGHTLVVPKTHVRNVLDSSADIFGQVMETVRSLMPAIKEGVGADGMRVAINNESAGGQDVFHLHAHVIPHHKENPPVFKKNKIVSIEEREVVAKNIRKQLS